MSRIPICKFCGFSGSIAGNFPSAKHFMLRVIFLSSLLISSGYGTPPGKSPNFWPQPVPNGYQGPGVPQQQQQQQYYASPPAQPQYYAQPYYAQAPPPAQPQFAPPQMMGPPNANGAAGINRRPSDRLNQTVYMAVTAQGSAGRSPSARLLFGNQQQPPPLPPRAPPPPQMPMFEPPPPQANGMMQFQQRNMGAKRGPPSTLFLAVTQKSSHQQKSQMPVRNVQQTMVAMTMPTESKKIEKKLIAMKPTPETVHVFLMAIGHFFQEVQIDPVRQHFSGKFLDTAMNEQQLQRRVRFLQVLTADGVDPAILHMVVKIFTLLEGREQDPTLQSRCTCWWLGKMLQILLQDTKSSLLGGGINMCLVEQKLREVKEDNRARLEPGKLEHVLETQRLMMQTVNESIKMGGGMNRANAGGDERIGAWAKDLEQQFDGSKQGWIPK